MISFKKAEEISLISVNFPWFLTLISSTELQRTGSVRSSSAFSNQLLKDEAFLAKVR